MTPSLGGTKYVMVEAATTFMFQSMDPGILGAVVLVGIPVVAITHFGIAARFPMARRSTTADAPYGAPAVEQR